MTRPSRAGAAAREAAIDFNDRLLQLAAHNGYPIELRPAPNGYGYWSVPEQLRSIVGHQIAVVRQ